jgi:hypothetical protein
MLMSTLLEVVHKLPRLVAADLQQRRSRHGTSVEWLAITVSQFRSTMSSTPSGRKKSPTACISLATAPTGCVSERFTVTELQPNMGTSPDAPRRFRMATRAAR